MPKQTPLSLSKAGLITAGLVLIAGILRTWQLPQTLEFLGDQGRDALIVSKIFTQGDLVFIGPVTSVGNMYLGPLYYYFMLPWLWLTYPSPIGPAYAVAILGALTVGLIYSLGKQLVGDRAALIAAGLMTFSATVIKYSRFSWNPNPTPFVALILIWATHQAWQKSPRYWLLVAICGAALAQLHYLALLTGIAAGFIWLWQFKSALSNNKKQLPALFGTTAIAVAIVLVSLAPLVLFDWKHDWLNARAFSKMMFAEQNFRATDSHHLIEDIGRTVKEMHGRSMHILFEYNLGQHRQTNTLLVLVTLSILGGLLLQGQSRNKHWTGYVVIASFLLTGIVGTAVYKHTVFDHYIAFLFPITFLVYGLVLDFLWQKSLGKPIVLLFVLAFGVYNYQTSPLKPAGWQISDMARTAQEIAKHTQPDRPYNIILFSPTKDLYGQNYRYFLSTTDHPPVAPEDNHLAQQLVIINEDPLIAEPLTQPVYELVTFPYHGIKESFAITNGPQITILDRLEDTQTQSGQAESSSLQ